MKKIFEKIPIYPFLTAVYPILFLLSVNISEVSPETGFRSALILLLFSLGAFLVALLITRNTQRSALTSFIVTLTFFLVFFLVYAPAYQGLREVRIFGETLGRHRYLMPATLLLLGAAELLVILLSRKLKPKSLRGVTQVLNLFSLILVLIPAITIISYMVKKQQVLSRTQANLPPLEQTLTVDETSAPDIYYLIFDMHTSDEVMFELMNYDDSGFTRALRERGFYVAPCSRSNYASTQFSITSSLNMNYIQELTASYETPALYPLMQYSQVRRILEDAGYKTHAFETGYSFTELNDADRYFSPLSGVVDLLTYPGLTPFESLVMQVSGGKILYETRDQLSQKMQFIIDAPYVEYRDRILFTLDAIPALAEEPGPKFVFAHILAPHDPFVFDEDGNTAMREKPFTMKQDPEYSWDSYRVAYIKEIQYLHKRIIEIVDELQANSRVQPIIIIQGDHGIPRTEINGAHFEIYNAINLAEDSSKDLYNTISPVNSFRVIFNNAFGANFVLLPDEAYILNEEAGTATQVTDGFKCP